MRQKQDYEKHLPCIFGKNIENTGKKKTRRGSPVVRNDELLAESSLFRN